MATIGQIAEIVFRRLNPGKGEDAPNLLGEYIARAETIFGARMYFKAKEEKRQDGNYEVPSNLLVPVVLDIANNRADISNIPILNTVSPDGVRGVTAICGTKYIRVSENEKDIPADYWGSKKIFGVQGNSLVFYLGTYSNEAKANVTYVTSDGDIDEDVANLITEELYKFYSPRVPEDNTQNKNSNT